MDGGFRFVPEAEMQALVGELVMLRGVVGAVIDAAGLMCSDTKAIQPEDLEELLVLHGLLRRLGGGCMVSPVTFGCMHEAAVRGAASPS